MNNIRHNFFFNTWFVIFLIALLSIIVSFFWAYPFDKVFYFWDSRLSFFDKELFDINASILSERLTVWNSNETAAGSSRPDVYTKAYPIFLEYILQNLFGFYGYQFYLFFITIFINWISSFFLFRQISYCIINNNSNLLSFLFSSFMSLSFFYTVLIYTNPINGFIYYFSFLPLNLFFFIKFIFNKKYILLFFISSILLSLNISHLAWFMVTIFWYFFIYILLVNIFKNNLKFLILSIFIYFVACLPVLFLVILDGSSKLNFHISAVGGNYLDIFRQFSSTLQTITFSSYYNFIMQHAQNWGGWSSFFVNNYILSFLLIITFLGYLYLSLKPKKRYLKISNRIIFLFLFSIILVSLPTNFFFYFNYIWNKFPIFSIYRGWDQKTGQIFYMSFLIFIFVINLITVEREFKKRIFIIFVIIFSIYSLPAFLGLNIFNKFGNPELGTYGKGVTSKIKFPQEYLNLNKFFDKHEHVRILGLPRDLTLNSDYFDDDTAYAAGYLLSNLTGKESSQGYEGDMYFSYLVYEFLNSDDLNNSLKKDLNKYGFTHVFIRKKYNSNQNFLLPNQNEPEEYKDIIKKFSKLIEDNEYYSLYKLNNTNEILNVKNADIHQLNSAIYELDLSRNFDKEIDINFNQSYNDNFILIDTSKNPISTECLVYKHIEEISMNICKKKNLFFQFSFLKLIFKNSIKETKKIINNNYSNFWRVKNNNYTSIVLVHKYQIYFYYLLILQIIFGLAISIINIIFMKEKIEKKINLV